MAGDRVQGGSSGADHDDSDGHGREGCPGDKLSVQM